MVAGMKLLAWLGLFIAEAIYAYLIENWGLLCLGVAGAIVIATALAADWAQHRQLPRWAIRSVRLARDLLTGAFCIAAAVACAIFAVLNYQSSDIGWALAWAMLAGTCCHAIYLWLKSLDWWPPEPCTDSGESA